jgi:hypothetical protein
LKTFEETGKIKMLQFGVSALTITVFMIRAMQELSSAQDGLPWEPQDSPEEQSHR